MSRTTLRHASRWGRLSPEWRHLFGSEPLEQIENFCGRVVSIRTKRKTTVPLVFNPIQTKLHRARTGDDLVVKARQEGVTTYFVADALAKAILFENERRVIAFHKEDARDAARRDILGYMWRHIDPDIRPLVSQDNRGGLYFPDWNSSIEVIALASDSGRSGMITGLHLSEAAFYKASVAAITESVPDEVGEISVESTGDDPSGEFYEAAMAALRGDSNQTLHFFGWQDNPEYSLRGKTELGVLDEEERALVRDLRVTVDQLRWRRRKKRSIGFLDDPTKFPKEYPSTVHEAFTFGSDRFFDVRLVDALERDVEADTCPVVEKRFEGWTFWEKPRADKAYIMSADISSGESKAASAACLLNVTDFTQAGEFHSKVIPTDYFATLLAEVGKEYGWAFLAPESNNMGHAVVSDLLHVHDYPNLYEHEPYHAVTKPAAGSDPWRTRQWGWATDMRTRPILFNSISRELRERVWVIRSLPLVDELRKTVRAKGKPKPGLGTTGDRVIAFGIALAMAEKFPAYSGGSIGRLNEQGIAPEGDRLDGLLGGTLTGLLKEDLG